MRSTTPRINRFAQVIRFFRVSRLLLWTLWVIYRERRRVIRAHARGNADVKPNVDILIDVLVAFRETALRLGVLMIKLGQFLSSRADLLPERALAVLGTLQDEVPAAPFEHVVAVIESELGKPVEEIFTVLERKCIAAASLGQVHRGVLKASGETVAVKVQRPNIEQLVLMDLSTIKFVIWLISRFVDTRSFIDLNGVYREFRRTVLEEIDYVVEANHAQRFKEMFKDDDTIYIPQVYDAYVSRRVIVLEWIDGIKVNDYAALDAAGINRLEVATRTVKAYFHQFFEVGLFHADPHPGNIFIKRDSIGYDPVIAFVDFGMVGTVPKTMRKAWRDVFVSFIMRDSRRLVNALNRLGFFGEGANLGAIEKALGMMLEQYYGITLGEVRDLDFSDVAQDVESLLYGQPFQLPAQLAFTGRAVGTLVGVSTGLAPQFDFIKVATPYARKFLGLDSEGVSQTFQQLLRQVVETGRVLLALPGDLEQVIAKIEAGQIEVKIANNPLLNRNGRRRRGNGGAVINGERRGGSSLSWAFMFTVSMAGGIFLLTNAHQIIPGWFCLGLSALLALGMLRR